MKAVSWDEICHVVVCSGCGYGYIATLGATYFVPYDFCYADECEITSDDDYQDGCQSFFDISLRQTPSEGNINQCHYWLKKIRINEYGSITFYFNRGNIDYSREFWTPAENLENSMIARCSASSAPPNLDVFGKFMYYVIQKFRNNYKMGITEQ